MNEFERGAIRVMGVLLVGILIILYLQLISCTNAVPPPPSDYIDEVEMNNFA